MADLPLPPEVVHMGVATGPCDVCAWPTENVHRRLVDEMRERHGKGGVNVCLECIKRAHCEAARAAGIEVTR